MRATKRKPHEDAVAALQSGQGRSFATRSDTDVKITGKTGDAFQFSAKDKKGASCTGTVTICESK